MFNRSARVLVRPAPFRSSARPHCFRPVPLSRPPTTPLQRVSLRYASNDRASTSHDRHHERATPEPSSKQPQQARNKKPQSHKPPKRRLEAASQPLRNAPSLTRGPVLQCIAHTTAEKYDFVSLGITLRSLGVRWDEVPEGDRERAFVIGPWKGRGGAERLISGKDIRRATLPPPGLVDGEVEEEGEMHDMGFGYGDRGEIWVFNSGSFVTWGMTEEEGRAFLREIIRRKGVTVEIERLLVQDHEVEEVDFVVDPTA